MHLYLHEKMQDIVEGHRNRVSVPQRVKFAIYKEKHLEKLVTGINCHIDDLYEICPLTSNEQEKFRKAEMMGLLQVLVCKCSSAIDWWVLTTKLLRNMYNVIFINHIKPTHGWVS